MKLPHARAWFAFRENAKNGIPHSCAAGVCVPWTLSSTPLYALLDFNRGVHPTKLGTLREQNLSQKGNSYGYENL